MMMRLLLIIFTASFFDYNGYAFIIKDSNSNSKKQKVSSLIDDTRRRHVSLSPCPLFSSSLSTRPFSLNSRRVKLQSSSSSDTTGDDVLSSSPTTTTSNNNKQTIAIVGSGAVGCYYGARLWETKRYNMKFHMRGEHFHECIKNGLNVTSIDGNIYIPPNELHAYESTNDMVTDDNDNKSKTIDWIIVALKSSSLGAIPSLIKPLLSESTRVMLIMNGLVEDDLLDMLCNDDDGSTENEDNDETAKNKHKINFAALYGGMALLCSNRIKPGYVDHSYAGQLNGGVAAAGMLSNYDVHDPIHEDEFHKLWKDVNVPTVFESSLLKGRWKKNMWNLPFNTLSVVMGGITIDKVVTDPGLRDLAYKIMNETIAIANADLKANGEENEYIDQSYSDLMMNFTDIMGPYKTSTMLDYTNRRSMEVQYLFSEPIKRANKLGVHVPHLATCIIQLESLQRLYNLF